METRTSNRTMKHGPTDQEHLESILFEKEVVKIVSHRILDNTKHRRRKHTSKQAQMQDVRMVFDLRTHVTEEEGRERKRDASRSFHVRLSHRSRVLE